MHSIARSIQECAIDMINNKARYNRIDANPNRWHSDQFQPTHIWNPWSNKMDANLEDSVCTVRVLFFPIVIKMYFGLTYKIVNTTNNQYFDTL